MNPQGAEYVKDLPGLARACPACELIAHYMVEGRKPVTVQCVGCGYEFQVQKYRRGERPVARGD